VRARIARSGLPRSSKAGIITFSIALNAAIR
jgi:hypothetical protein